MFERYSDEARTIVSRATDEAGQLGHDHIGTEHLLLGLLSDEGNITARALPLGTTIPVVRRKVAEAVGTNGSVALAAGRSGRVTPADEPEAGPRELPLTARARRALERASRFSIQRREPNVEPTHVLLGVLDVEGTAGQVLRGLGVDVGRLRDAVDRKGPGPVAAPLPLTVPPAPPPPAAPVTSAPGPAAGPAAAPAVAEPALVGGSSSPNCVTCGAAIEMTLAYRMVSARNEAGQRRPFVVAFCSSCGAALGASPA